MKHVMVDIETLGTKPGSVILSIGACRFDESGVGERFYRPIDVFDSLMHGLKVDEATIGFWRLQSAEAKGALKPGFPLEMVLAAFEAFLAVPGCDTLWAKGPDFDLVLLSVAYAAIGQKQPWSYRIARDVRTISAMCPRPLVIDANLKEGVKHNALDDAVRQAELVRAVAKAIGVELA